MSSPGSTTVDVVSACDAYVTGFLQVKSGLVGDYREVVTAYPSELTAQLLVAKYLNNKYGSEVRVYFRGGAVALRFTKLPSDSGATRGSYEDSGPTH